MPRHARRDLLAKFHDMIARRQPIIGGGAGTGLSATGSTSRAISFTISLALP
jgi:predicted TIM-barrel enzyme